MPGDRRAEGAAPGDHDLGGLHPVLRRRRPGRASGGRAPGRARGRARAARCLDRARPRAPGSDSPAGPSSIDMQCECPLPISMSSGQMFSAAVPVVVRVVVLGRNEAARAAPAKSSRKPWLELVHAHGAGRVRRVDAADAVADAARRDRLADLVRDVGDGEATGRPELHLVLEGLHRRTFNPQSRAAGAKTGGYARRAARSSAG